MSLKRALEDCLIDFDNRVLVTDLLEQYKLSYKEVHETLEAHIKQQELNVGTKYEKRFLVHGQKAEATGAPTQMYTIVQGESKLKEWLRKLQNAQSTLYSVEIAGGSKAPAQIFKPMQHVEVKLAKQEQRAVAPTFVATTSNGMASKTIVKIESKPAPPAGSNGHSTVATNGHSSNGKVDAAPASKKQDSPVEQKKAKAAPTGKKGSINSFFTAGAAAKTQPTPAKETKAAAKTAASSMDNYFKKQPASQPAKAPKSPTPSANPTPARSPDIIEDSSSSSDEEEKLDKLRRKVLSSDEETEQPSSSKRRRIVDSDDEEQPQKKSTDAEQQTKEETKTDTPASEAYLDEDGFVVTIKSKKPTPVIKKKTSPPAASAPKAKKKTPPSTKKASTASAPAKTKQGNIMSFFTKK